MTRKLRQRLRYWLGLSTCAFLIVAASLFSRTRAQAHKPILISEATSTRAVAVDSVTQTREPFATTSSVSWSADNHTRIMLFAQGLNAQADASTITAEAEDGAHNFYQLTVEYVGPVPNQGWMSSIVVRLDDQMENVGDVLVEITFQGVASNRVRVGIGHIGDGLPDDPGAVPTPGTIAPPSPQPAATAGTL